MLLNRNGGFNKSVFNIATDIRFNFNELTMLSTILVYVSLFLQVAAAVIAISLFKRTKFNASWILISVGFLLMVVSRVFDLWPTIYPEMEDELLLYRRFWLLSLLWSS